MNNPSSAPRRNGLLDFIESEISVGIAGIFYVQRFAIDKDKHKKRVGGHQSCQKYMKRSNLVKSEIEVTVYRKVESADALST